MFNVLSDFIVKRYRAIFLGSIMVMILAFMVASNIGMDSKMEGMLPSGSESLKASAEYDRYFDSQDNVLVVARGEGGQCEGYLAELHDRIISQGIAGNVLYKVELDSLKGSLHLYIDSKNYKSMAEEMADASSPLSMFLKQKDFGTLTKLFTQRLGQAEEGRRQKLLDSFTKLIFSEAGLDEKEQKGLFAALFFGEITKQEELKEYISSKDGDTYLMIIKPKVGMNSFMEDRTAFFKGLETSMKELKDTGRYRVEAGITGGAFVQDNEADNTMFDGFFSTALLTFAIILLFIVVSFRKIILPISTGYPLLLGAILATSFAYLAYSNLNIFSISFAVLLLGLGIDFGVHILSRYLEEREAGHTPKEAVRTTIRQTSAGMFVGAVTTAVAFLTFLIAEFKAFTQMGVISGIGILLLCITMILVVPSIILLMDTKRRKNSVSYRGYDFLVPLGKAIERKPVYIAAAVGLLAILLIGNVLRTDIKTDMSRIYPQNMECLRWLDVVEEEFDFNPNTLTFMVDDIEALEEAVGVLEGRSDVRKLNSVLEYLPKDQNYKRSVIKTFNAKLLQEPEQGAGATPAGVVLALESIMEAAKAFKLDTDSEGYRTINQIQDGLRRGESSEILGSMSKKQNKLKNALNTLAIHEEMLVPTRLPESLKSNYVGKQGRLSVEVVPRTDLWNAENFNELARGIKAASGRTPVGMPAIMNEITAYAKQDILRISGLCFAALFIILLILFRSLKNTAVILMVLFFTILITIGIMPVLGVDMNIFSIIAFPVLIGIGVDSGVHLLHRIKHSPDRDIPYILAHTGKAVTMTTITTLIGFGSLSFVNHPGLASFGLTTVIGMFVCLVLTVTLLPALHILFEGKK